MNGIDSLYIINFILVATAFAVLVVFGAQYWVVAKAAQEGK